MPKRPEDLEAEHRWLAIAAARLRSENLTQAEIAARLDKSQPEVSRLVSHAQKHHYLAQAPAFLKENVREADLAEVERRFFVNEKLLKALRGSARPGRHLDVRVLPENDEAFATAAASHLGELLRRARVVGIMWGRNLARLVARLPGCLERAGQVRDYEAQCIPLCGDPVHLMNLGQVKYSASHLAAELGQAINPERPSDQPALMGVPAYLSRAHFLSRGSNASWQDFVQEIPGYRDIFGPANGKDKPWVERVDTIISGAGIIAKPSRRPVPVDPEACTAAHEGTGDFIRERLRQETGIEEGELAKLIYGDIGGLLVGRHDLEAGERRIVDSLNQGWTGIRARHLVSVARGAKPRGVPGVILVAAGPAKAEMVLELLRLGFVNVLLIDSSLAAALG